MSFTKVAIAQLGARKHYQEPILLHQWGLLDTLYTDFYAGHSLLTQALRHRLIICILPAVVKRILDRYDPALSVANIVHFPQLGYRYANELSHLGAGSAASIFSQTGKSFCRYILDYGLGDASIVYGFNSSCLELFEYAEQKGLRRILDQTLAERSYYYKIMQAEESRWPGWSCRPFRLTHADQELAEREQREQDLADQIICGSNFVKDSLMARGISAEKVTVVPLGRIKELEPLSSSSKQITHSSTLPWQERSEGLRILFAGTVGLRKGMPYLLEALHALKGDFPFVCRAAGRIDLITEVIDSYHDVCQFLGQVPRSEMSSLYTWADVFVLPSLCEGSAMVTYEAMFWGLPIITTHSSGSIVQDGVNGLIVSDRDSSAISQALKAFYQGSHRPDTCSFRQHAHQVRESSKSLLMAAIIGERA